MTKLIDDVMTAVEAWIVDQGDDIAGTPISILEENVTKIVDDAFAPTPGCVVEMSKHLAVNGRVRECMLAALQGLTQNPGVFVGQEKDTCLRAYRFAIVSEYVRDLIYDMAGDNPGIEDLYRVITQEDEALRGAMGGLQ